MCLLLPIAELSPYNVKLILARLVEYSVWVSLLKKGQQLRVFFFFFFI